jgi:benzylsuccinate CoA-transferase BbsF subunit
LAELSRNPRIAPSPARESPEEGEALPALAGVKSLDLMWAMAGPAATRVLADYGAAVVRVESTHRVEVARTLGPWHNRQPGPENSGAFQTLNAGKLGITLDLTKEAGRAVLHDLVRWADVVAEAFSPKAMRAWGLDYESLRKVKPNIIMVSTCLMGQTGPLSMLAGFGNMAAAISGFHNLTGWPDRTPAGPYLAYTDTVSPRFTAVAIMAALEYRQRTGRGQYIDQSQAEAALHFLGPALLDYTVNGRVQERMGNRDPQMAPHGVYPAAGEDRWVAIAVGNDEQWQALCEVIERPEMVRDERFETMAARLAHQNELDTIVGEWTSRREMQEVEAALQARGVPASAVQNSGELYGDPQLAHRGHFVAVEHEVHGTTTVEGSRFRLSRTPARIERSGPTFGRDNEHVLKEILGYDDERIAELIATGALE